MRVVTIDAPMAVVDTAFVSELMRPAPAVTMSSWADERAAPSLFRPAVTKAERRRRLVAVPPDCGFRAAMAQRHARQFEGIRVEVVAQQAGP